MGCNSPRVKLGSVNFNQGMPLQPTPLRPRILPQLEQTPALAGGDSAVLSTPPPSPVLAEQPVVAGSLAVVEPVVARTPAPVVPQTLALEMGEVGFSLLSPGSPQGPTYSSTDGSPNNTLGWSGQASPQASLHKSHLPQIHSGLQFADQIMPGFQSKMDQLLHTQDAALQGKMDAIVNEQNHLMSSQGRLLAMPDDRLQPHQLKQKSELTARIDSLARSYVAAEKELEAKTYANSKQAEQLAGTFLSRLRKHGRVADVNDRVKIDASASAQLKKDGIGEETVGHWINEFHHQTGLPAPRQLKFTYTEERPCYTSQSDAVNIGAKFNKRLALHEIAHRAEYKFPEISIANKDWVRARSQNAGFSSEPTQLQTLAPHGKYKDDEVALQDHFVNPYVGKVYPDLASEVLSMGLEHFAGNQELVKLYSQDPEHFFLTLGAIKTMHAKEQW